MIVRCLLALLFVSLVTPSVLAQKPRAGVSALLDKKTFSEAGGQNLHYRLLKPENPDPSRRYPLVVFLHGAGERGDDNEKQLVHGVPEFASAENRAKYPCFLIAPQCPTGDMWANVDWASLSHRQAKEPTVPGRLVLALIETAVKEHAVDAKRIYLTGLSMGGYGSWELAIRRPDLFAAVVPVCGGADETQAERIAKLPIWAFHGARDGVVKPERSRRMIDALRQAGGVPGYTEYPHVGHDSWNPAYRDGEMMRWLFAQKKP